MRPLEPVRPSSPALTEILPTGNPDLFEAAVTRAAALLGQGELVAVPTETVYGLAANALDAAAVAKIFAAKGRPANNPIIVHVTGLEMARRCVRDWPSLADKLAAAFWPGPLTLVLPAAESIPRIVTAGGDTVGVRWPGHPFIRAVIQRCGFPLAAPSANRSTQLSPTTADHVLRSLGSRVPLIVDGGPSHVGIESTVLDLTTSPPRLLRPGMIHEQSLLAVTGKLRVGDPHADRVLKSPGLLRKHYSPRSRLAVWSWQNDAELKRRSLASGVAPGHTNIIAHTHIPAGGNWGRVSVIPHDPPAFARAIYGELFKCDETGAELIVVEALPDQPEWRAIADRLSRASAE